MGDSHNNLPFEDWEAAEKPKAPAIMIWGVLELLLLVFVLLVALGAPSIVISVLYTIFFVVVILLPIIQVAISPNSTRTYLVALYSAGSIGVLLGIWFKISKYPQPDGALIVGCASLMLFYLLMPFYRVLKWKGDGLTQVLSIFYGAAISLTLGGLLSRAQQWPYTNPLLISGAILGTLGTLFLLWKIQKDAANRRYYLLLFPRLLIFAAMAWAATFYQGTIIWG